MGFQLSRPVIVGRAEAANCHPSARISEGRLAAASVKPLNGRWGLFTILRWMALRAKIGPDEAEPEGCGGSTVEGENEIWPDFSPQPFGPGPIFPISSSIVASRHPVCVTPHSLNSEKLAPGATAPVVGTGPSVAPRSDASP